MGFDRERYDMLRAALLCVRCKGDSPTGTSSCKDCRKKMVRRPPTKKQIRKQTIKRRKQMRREGRCIRCRKEKIGRCDNCARYHRATYLTKKPTPGAKRVCTVCRGTVGPPRHNRSSCPLRFRSDLDIDGYATSRHEVVA